eukprot:GABV01000406.1.p1 GENE.GABV01000406.1~~GABV01000406.1.p1  ORF type:complete len:204 (+),score=35.53 GABV01000406.1:713-1324(+)
MGIASQRIFFLTSSIAESTRGLASRSQAAASRVLQDEDLRSQAQQGWSKFSGWVSQASEHISSAVGELVDDRPPHAQSRRSDEDESMPRLYAANARPSEAPSASMPALSSDQYFSQAKAASPYKGLSSDDFFAAQDSAGPAAEQKLKPSSALATTNSTRKPAVAAVVEEGDDWGGATKKRNKNNRQQRCPPSQSLSNRVQVRE